MSEPAAVNPYSAPASEVEKVSTSGEVVFCDAKKLTAGQGNRIIADAWRIYKTSPVKWSVVSIALFAVMIAISMIPLAGSLLGTIIYTPLFAGLLIGARDIELGGKLKFAHLFSAIMTNGKGVFGLAIVVTLLSMVNMGVVFGLMGSEYFMAMYAGEELDPTSLVADPQKMLMGTFVMLIGTALLVMLSWFATPLIALQSVGVLKAIGMSFKASLKNWLALTVYGFVMAFWMIVSMIPVGLGLFIMIPILSISIYTSYRRIFTE